MGAKTSSHRVRQPVVRAGAGGASWTASCPGGPEEPSRTRMFLPAMPIKPPMTPRAQSRMKP
eukprot:5287689-Alexandrium_andersonii.AAC.1